MATFVARLNEINALADDRILFNLSVWRTLDDLRPRCRAPSKGGKL